MAAPLKNRKTGTDPDTIGSCFCLPYSPAASKATAPVASAETSAPESAAASEAAAPVTASAKASAAKPAAASETAAPVAASAETAAAESTKTASKAAAPMVIAVVAVRRLRPGRRRAVAHMPPPENRTVDHRRHAHAGLPVTPAVGTVTYVIEYPPGKENQQHKPQRQSSHGNDIHTRLCHLIGHRVLRQNLHAIIGFVPAQQGVESIDYAPVIIVAVKRLLKVCNQSLRQILVCQGVVDPVATAPLMLSSPFSVSSSRTMPLLRWLSPTPSSLPS